MRDVEDPWMATRSDQQRLTPDERSNLVAYLDGELSEPESRLISTKLPHSPTARHELETLQKTWELLDYLERPSARDDFSERTFTVIRNLEVVSPTWSPVASVWGSMASRVLLASALGIAGLVIGYFLTRDLIPDPTARVAANLSLAEHLDEYLQVDSFDFLAKLADSPEFTTDTQ